MSEADRQKWNARWRDAVPSFEPHPIVVAALAAGIPTGPILELACGPSGSALALAAAGRHVVAVDVSEVALAQLAAEATTRGLTTVEPVCQDLPTWRAPVNTFALVFAVRYWDRVAFGHAAHAVKRGGLLAWETFTLDEQRYRPSFSADFLLGPGEPAFSLPVGGFKDTTVTDLDDGRSATRRLIARRA